MTSKYQLFVPPGTTYQVNYPVPAPTITNARATPASLPAGGGSVVIDATVTDATQVTLDGVPVTLPFTTNVTASHSFVLVAHGVTAPDAQAASIAVTVAAAPAGVLRVHPSKGMTNTIYLCQHTRARWLNQQQQRGDFVDKNGVANGPTATLVCQGNNVDISSIADDLMIQGAPNVNSVMIDGVDVSAKCFWIHPTSNQSLTLPSFYGSPVIVPQSGGRAMVLSLTNTFTGQYRVDAVLLPVVPDLPYTGPFRAPDIFDVTCANQASITNTVPGTTYAVPLTIDPSRTSYLVDGTLPFIRIGNRLSDLHPRLTNWFFPINNLDECYFGHGMRIDASTWAAMREQGVKLSSLKNSSDAFWLDMQHSAAYQQVKNPRNAGIFGLDHYARDATTGGGAIVEPTNAFSYMAHSRWYWLEMFMKLNTPNVKDGALRMWLNGHLICDELRMWRSDATVKINQAQGQVYHGGTLSWLASAFYDLTMYRASSQYIGVPPEMRALAA